jgi:hypothetical protein
MMMNSMFWLHDETYQILDSGVALTPLKDKESEGEK